MKHNSEFWPNQNQLALLKACTMEGEDGRKHYAQWKSSLKLNPQKSGDQLLAIVFDQIDHGSQRLLPLLHYNLAEDLPDEPVIQAIKGYNRYVWSKNQIIFYQVKKIINLLNESHIQHFFVKGVPLAKLYYSFDGIRPMSDLDVIVKEADLDKTCELLTEAGWFDMYTDKDVDYKKLIAKSRNLIDKNKNELDIHWRTFKDSFKEEVEAELWDNLIEFKVDDLTAKTLNPTYQLLHTIIHGMQWNELPSFRWICDSMIILKTSEIDWPTLLSFSKRRKYMLRLSLAFNYLRDEFGANIPEFVQEELSTFKASSLEQKFVASLMKSNEQGSWSHLLMRHYQFQLYYNNSNIFKEIWIFLNNYGANWGTKNVLHSALHLFGHLTGISKHPQTKLGNE